MNNNSGETFHNAKVLICDDDPTYLLVMRDTLESENFQVIDASDGDTAITKYLTYQPDIVLLDVQMPGMSGLEVCKQIRQHKAGKDVPILMVTGADDYASIQSAYDIGATDFLPKPIKWPIVGHRVRYMLRTRNALRDLQSSEEQLRYLAYHDDLTGLANRQSFREHLQKFLTLAKRDKHHVGVLFIDLDRFKRINDTLGHEFGDKLLAKVAKILLNNLRDCDLIARDAKENDVSEVARLGGDEFIVMLSKVGDTNDIAQVAQRIIDSVSKPIKIGQYEVVVTPSLGISVYPHDGENGEELMKNADVAMYYAKERGRRCYKFYSDSLNARALERLQLEESLRTALVREEFELYYQPQVDLKSEQITSVEALIRWNHPTLGMVSPGEFIPIAEETGLIIEIGEWVMKTACAQAKSWIDEGYPPCRMSINLSSVQFKRSALTETIKEVIEETGLPPEYLELELTESAVMTDVEQNIQRLKQLKNMGIKIAIDDFGTGYSSLSYLKKFPIDTLKIDRSFVTDLAENKEDEAIVKAIMALADTMNLGVIAEGVESQSQLAILRQYECELIQGYLFSRPLNKDDIGMLLKNGLPKRKQQ